MLYVADKTDTINHTHRKDKNMNKVFLTGIIGTVGSVIASFFGGWTASLTTLLIFMAIDYGTGMVVAGVFHKSPKTETGALESRAGFKGLCQKCGIMLLVLMGYRVDLAMGSSYVRDAICIAFIVNEAISITENLGLMGVPIPPVFKNAIDILKKKGSEKNE